MSYDLAVALSRGRGGAPDFDKAVPQSRRKLSEIMQKDSIQYLVIVYQSNSVPDESTRIIVYAQRQPFTIQV